jgi:predicted thioredoxin/glutaredoxin
LGSDTDLVDPFERQRLADGRLVTRREALAQAVTERVVELVISALDVNALLDRVDLNAVLDQVDMDRVLDRIDLDRLLGRMDLNDIVQRLDVDALVEQTDLGAVIAASSSGVASNTLDVVRSQAVGLDEFIARWIGRLRRRPYSGPPGPPDGPRAEAAS